MPTFDLTALLGLPLEQALGRLEAAGLPAPHVAKSVPSRTRHALPDQVDWRIARVGWTPDDVPDLVAVPSVPLPTGLPTDSDGA